mmetsp:Transcript_35930/g.107978  ORF Transcript_35930/g.107978 Transcript_35930/m.107978 type:complete len:235 (-) Transcript_35930:1470-2174(-)
MTSIGIPASGAPHRMRGFMWVHQALLFAQNICRGKTGARCAAMHSHGHDGFDGTRKRLAQVFTGWDALLSKIGALLYNATATVRVGSRRCAVGNGIARCFSATSYGVARGDGTVRNDTPCGRPKVKDSTACLSKHVAGRRQPVTHCTHHGRVGHRGSNIARTVKCARPCQQVYARSCDDGATDNERSLARAALLFALGLLLVLFAHFLVSDLLRECRGHVFFTRNIRHFLLQFR